MEDEREIHEVKQSRFFRSLARIKEGGCRGRCIGNLFYAATILSLFFFFFHFLQT